MNRRSSNKKPKAVSSSTSPSKPTFRFNGQVRIMTRAPNYLEAEIDDAECRPELKPGPTVFTTKVVKITVETRNSIYIYEE